MAVLDIGGNKLACNGGILLKGSLRPANSDGQVVSFEVAAFAHTLSKTVQHAGRWRCRREHSNPTLRSHRSRLLRTRRKRPCSRRTADERDELASPHSITSCARPSSVIGKVMPSGLAALKLRTSSIFTACSTGRSADHLMIA